MTKLASAVSIAAILAATPAAADFGGRHVDTQTEHQTQIQSRSETHTRTVHQPNPVDDVTHERVVTRVHHIHHVTVITRYLHHAIRKDRDDYVTHRTVAPERVVESHSIQTVGTPAPARERTVTQYKDVYIDDYQTVVHEIPVQDTDLYIHRHVTDITEQPVVHEHTVTQVVLDNYYVPKTVAEPVTEDAGSRTVITQRREDVDP